MDDNISKMVHDARAGNRQAFESLFNAYRGRIYILALTILKNKDKAEDIVQETFITVLAKINTLKEDAAFPAWVNRIAVNKCKSLLRRREIRVLKKEENLNVLNNIAVQDENFIPVSYMENKEKRGFIAGLINDLPIQQRTALVLFYYHNLSIKEIAQIMDSNENTVKSRLFLAKKSLKKHIEHVLAREGVKEVGYLYSAAPLSQILAEYAVKNNLNPQVAAELFQNINSSPSAPGSANQSQSSASSSASSNTGVIVAVVVAASILAVCLVAVFAYWGDQNNTAEASPSNAVQSVQPEASDGNSNQSEATPNASSVPSNTPDPTPDPSPTSAKVLIPLSSTPASAATSTTTSAPTPTPAPLAPVITSTALPDATAGTPYIQALFADGDTPVTWSIESGILPDGLSLSADTISGTPTAPGAFNFTLKAQNSAGCDTKPFSILITAAPVAPSITTTSLPYGSAGIPYSQTLSADGDAPITWSIESGSLPDGLSLSADTISGTPTAPGIFNFNLKAQNSAGFDIIPLSITMRYVQDFNTPASCSGWGIVSGSGNMNISNEVLKVNVGSGNVILVDSNSPDYADGFYEGVFTMVNGQGRTGLVFRYVDTTTWAFIGYDINNNWVWVNGLGEYATITTSGPELSAGDSAHLKVQFTGSDITVWINGTEYFNGAIPNLPTGAGKIGVRSWLNSNANYDNLQYYP